MRLETSKSLEVSEVKKLLLVTLIAFYSLILLPQVAHSDESQATVVLLDTSGSMRGEKLIEAKKLLIDAVSTGQANFSIYTFAETVNIIPANSSSQGENTKLIDSIEAGSRTSLYDAIQYLMTSVMKSPSQLIVISDGGDSQSASKLEEIIKLASERNIPISFLRDFIDSRYKSNLAGIVSASGGTFLASLPKSFLESPQQTQVTNSKKPSQSLAVGLSVGYSLLLALIVNRIRTSRQAQKKLAADLHIVEQTPHTESRKESPLLFLSRQLDLIKEKLRQGRRNLDFERELPGALKMLAGSLGAGLSFLQALHAYAEDGEGVSAQEFRRALGEIQLGVPIERALESVADRVKSEDLKWAVSAFAIQREVGGSLATILKSVAETIESRFELRREIKTLSAEGRISTYVLMALPAVIFLFLSLLRPAYVSFYITQPIGNLILIFIAFSLMMSWLWMRSLVRIEI